MKYLTIGVVTLLAVAALSFTIGPHDHRAERAEIMFTGIGIGIAAMFCVAMLGRYQERVDQRRDAHRAPNRRVKLMSGLVAAFVPTLAHAIAMFILGAVAIGAAVGLIAWGAIELWSAVLSKAAEINRGRAHVAMVTVSDVPILAAAPPVEPVETNAVSVLPVYESVLVSTAPWIYVTRPVGAPLEWSINLVDWAVWDEQPITATLPSAFWRVK